VKDISASRICQNIGNMSFLGSILDGLANQLASGLATTAAVVVGVAGVRVSARAVSSYFKAPKDEDIPPVVNQPVVTEPSPPSPAVQPSAHQESVQDSADELCSICKCDLHVDPNFPPIDGLPAAAEIVKTLACGHRFHDACIDRLVYYNYDNSPCCPYCRGPVYSQPASLSLDDWRLNVGRNRRYKLIREIAYYRRS
jgi:hypothetical protein